MEGEKRKREKKKEWYDLCEDIVSLILQRLTRVDQIRFSATCKSWQLASTDHIQLQRKIPWIMEYADRMTNADRRTKLPQLWLLYEPRLKWREDKNMTMTMISPPYIVKDFLSGTVLCGSRFGWLLWGKGVGDRNISYKDFYIYSPLTKETISLPRYECEQLNKGQVNREIARNIKYATLTSVPNSDEYCTFVVVLFGKHRYIFVISSFSIINGDDTQKWNTRIVCPHWKEYFLFGPLMVYMNGMLYFCSKKGGLSSFNIATQEWSVIRKTPWASGSGWPFLGFIHAYLVGYGGDLYAVFDEHKNREENSSSSGSSTDYCRVEKFDWLERTWKKIESLEGGVIFLNLYRNMPWYAFGMSEEELRFREQTEVTANRVYYFDRSFQMGFYVYGPQKKNGDGGGENKLDMDMIHWDIPSPSSSTTTATATTTQVYHGYPRIWIEPPPIKIDRKVGLVNEYIQALV